MAQISIVTAILLCRRMRMATRGCTSSAASSEAQVLRVPWTVIRGTLAVMMHRSKLRLKLRGSARTGIEAAPGHSVAIQLAAQEAKAWARIGDRRATEVALDRGRKLLEAMPHPDNLDHHFVVDPTKFDFYSMDCYRHLAEDRLAETLANEVIHASTDFDGTERAPMRPSRSPHYPRGSSSTARRSRTSSRAW